MTVSAPHMRGKMVSKGASRSNRGKQPLKTRAWPLRSKVMVAIILCACVGLGIYNHESLARFVNRPVANIDIAKATRQVSAEEINRLLAGYIGDGFFDVEVTRARDALEAHPWIYQASVKRVWPGTLSVEIMEQVAIARWGENYLLNQFGETFRPDNLRDIDSLPQLRGPEESQFEVMEQYQAISQLLQPEGLRLSGLALSPRGSWELWLNEELHVVAGRDDVMSKLQRFVNFYASQPGSLVALFASVDLRYGNGIAVKRKDEELTSVAIR